MADLMTDAEWNRVDKDEATAALQALIGLVPQHAISQAIDLFTTVHEYIVLAPEPLALAASSEEYTVAGPQNTSDQGWIRPSEGGSLARMDLTGPGEPLSEGTEDEIEQARRGGASAAYTGQGRIGNI